MNEIPNPNEMNPEDPESWDDLASDLFGIQFSEEVDLDAISDVVDQIHGVPEPEEPKDQPEESSEVVMESTTTEVDLFAAFDEAVEHDPPSLDSKESEEEAEQPATEPVARSISEKPSKPRRARRKQSDDAFGLGIFGDEIPWESDDDMTEDEEDVVSEVDEASLTSEPETPVVSEVSEDSDQQEADVVQAEASASDDDFWDALEEWNWDEEKSKGRRSRTEANESSEADADLDSGDDEQEEKPRRKRRRPPRRRSRKRPVEQEPVEELADEEFGDSLDDEQDEIAAETQAEDIDRLWDDGEESESPQQTESSKGQRKRSRPARKRRREEPEDDDFEDQDTDEPRKKPKPESRYRNIPSWSDAISYVVKVPKSSRGEKGNGSDEETEGRKGQRRGGGRGSSRGRRRSSRPKKSSD